MKSPKEGPSEEDILSEEDVSALKHIINNVK